MRISDWSSDVCSSDLGILSAGEEGEVRRLAERVAREIEPGITIYERSSVAKGPCQIPAFIAVEPGVQPGGVCIQLDALDRSRLYFHLGPVDRRRSRVLKHGGRAFDLAYLKIGIIIIEAGDVQPETAVKQDRKSTRL